MTQNQFQSNLLMLVSLLKQIGEQKELSQLSRIKDSADHAGLLQLLLLMKVIKFNSKVNLKLLVSVNNSLLIAQIFLLMIMMVAMEALQSELLNTLKISDKLQLINILMLLQIKNAKFQEDHIDLLE